MSHPGSPTGIPTLPSTRLPILSHPRKTSSLFRNNLSEKAPQQTTRAVVHGRLRRNPARTTHQHAPISAAVYSLSRCSSPKRQQPTICFAFRSGTCLYRPAPQSAQQPGATLQFPERYMYNQHFNHIATVHTLSDFQKANGLRCRYSRHSRSSRHGNQKTLSPAAVREFFEWAMNRLHLKMAE